MQIHNVTTTHHGRTIDPGTDRPKPAETVVEPSGVHRIVHDEQTYEVRPDGTFDVPDDLADVLCAQPEWARGPNPCAPDVPAPPKAAPSRRPRPSEATSTGAAQ